MIRLQNNIRRSMKAALCAALMLSGILSGCAQRQAVEITEDGLRSSTQAIAAALSQGDWKTARSYFNHDLKQSLTEKLLQEGYESATSGLSFEALGDVTAVMNDEMNAGWAVLDFQDAQRKVFVQYDQAMQAERIIINEVHALPALASTDAYTEQAVAIGPLPQVQGILTLPNGVSNPPAVVMAAGSGVSDCNEEIQGSKPFEDIAHGLAELGVASIRFDKRYYDYPELIKDNSEATVDQEYMEDIAYALHLLDSEPVDPSRIYYLGHSEGAMIAHAVADMHYEAAGIILLAGTARSLPELLYDQTEAALKQQGADQKTIDAQLKTIQDAETQIDALQEDSEKTTILGIGSTYWYQLKQYGAKNHIDKVKVPTLILQGQDDAQVYYDKDYALWKELLGDKDNVSMKSYPGLNHLFIDSSLQPGTDYSKPGHVSSEVIQDVADWISGKSVSDDAEADKTAASKDKASQ